MPSQLSNLLAQEPRVFTIALQCSADSNSYLRSIYATLNIAIYVTALVCLRKQIMEVKEGYSVTLVSKVRIVVVVTTHIVYLTIRDKQLGNLTL